MNPSNGGRNGKPSNHIDESEYRKHLAAASASGNYFIFREAYLEILSRDATLVLQKCINKHGYLLKKGALPDDGFFTFTVKHLLRLKMKKDCQARILRELQGYDSKGKLHESRAFIKVSKRGVPPKRVVWIDFLKLNRALDENPMDRGSLVGKSRSSGNTDDSASVKPDDPYINEGIIIPSEEKKPRRSHGGRSAPPDVSDRHPPDSGFSFTSPQPITPPYHKPFGRQCAVKLHEALLAQGMLTAKAKLHHWEEEFSVLRQYRTEQEITKVLDWYVQNLRREYVPLAQSAKTFRQKFVSIETAMNIHQEHARNQGRRPRPNEHRGW